MENNLSNENQDNSYTEYNIDQHIDDINITNESGIECNTQRDVADNIADEDQLTNIVVLKKIWNFAKDNLDMIFILFSVRFIVQYFFAQAESQYYHIPIKYFFDNEMSFSVVFFSISVYLFTIVWPVIKFKIIHKTPSLLEIMASIIFISIIIFAEYCSIFESTYSDIYYIMYDFMLFIGIFVLSFMIRIIYKYCMDNNILTEFRKMLSIIISIIIISTMCTEIPHINNTFMMLMILIFVIEIVITIMLTVNIIIAYLNTNTQSNTNFEKAKIFFWFVITILVIFASVYISLNLIEIERGLIYRDQYELMEINDPKGVKYKAVITQYSDYLVVMDCEIKEDDILHIYYNRYEVIEQYNDSGKFIFDKDSLKHTYKDVKIELE